jgi:hypothetical protein
MSFNNYFPSDVIALKQRIAPWVSLVDTLVARTLTLPRDTRAGWRSFVSEWSLYMADEGTFFSPQRYARGLELEAKLRDWRSALSSQVPGVPPPAPKRHTPFFGTWASPSDVRAEKVRVDSLMRDLNERLAAFPTADPALRKAWSEFFRGWTLFFNQEDEWIHGATQLECAQAYGDSVLEWREAIETGCQQPAPSPPATVPGTASPPSGPATSPAPSASQAPPAAPPPWLPPVVPPWSPQPTASAKEEEGWGLSAANIFITFGMLGLGFLMATARKR